MAVLAVQSCQGFLYVPKEKARPTTCVCVCGCVCACFKNEWPAARDFEDFYFYRETPQKEVPIPHVDGFVHARTSIHRIGLPSYSEVGSGSYYSSIVLYSIGTARAITTLQVCYVAPKTGVFSFLL